MSESFPARNPDTMAAAVALKVAKKELRSLMKKKLSDISSLSVNTQSTVTSQQFFYLH
jgi:hypothetical protein